MRSHVQHILMILAGVVLTSACSTHKNTARSRFWQSFTAKYNTYYNGSQAFLEGNLEKEKANKDNYTEMIPLYAVGNKQSRTAGKSNYDRAIEKMEKTIKQHSIKAKPEWKKQRRKTAKEKEWLSRREYNPFLWKAWMMLGKSQFQKGDFDEAAATFSYIGRLYQTQPAIYGMARAWQARCYTELGWLYDAEDVIRNMSRDSIHYRARKDWDCTLANYYVRSGELQQAVPYLRKAIGHERRKKQKAREWFLMGQILTTLGQREEAYKAFRSVTRQNPPYELEFNARIAQTEVMSKGHSRQMISRLKHMASDDNNKDYLDQVYYAIGNIYLAERDTLRAIAAYEKGNEKATRNGIEKGVLLLKLGNLYWQREKYKDAQRCYGEAIGLLDKERPDYEELSTRSKVLDELVPHTDAIYLQDSLQLLAKLPEADRNKAIDRVIDELKRKEKEEKRLQQEQEAERQSQRNATTGNRSQRSTNTANTTNKNSNGLWYFYNPQAVSQGKQQFQRLWGRRENVDDWQRSNRTVVTLSATEDTERQDSLLTDGTDQPADTLSLQGTSATETATSDSLAQDPHQREYYLAQIPFTEEQLAESDNLIKDGLINSGIIFKDKLDNLRLSEKSLMRLTTAYPDYERNDEALYHLFLLYSRQGEPQKADECLEVLKERFPESQWTILLSNPYYEENARFGQHLEDSLYAATYEAFKANRYAEVRTNTQLSEERFPLGDNRPKFLFIDGLGRLNSGDGQGCLTLMKEVVEKYPQSEVSPLAGMIVKGVQEGRALYGGKFDLGDVWSRRDITMAADTVLHDTLSTERNTNFIFLLVYHPDSVNEHQLLYDMARYNFTNFLVRNFDLNVERSNQLCRMYVSGFLNYDEALQYARQLYGDRDIADRLRPSRHYIISEQNLPLLGTRISYEAYELFYQQTFLPLDISTERLLDIPEETVRPEDDEQETPDDEDDGRPTTDDEDFDLDDLFF